MITYTIELYSDLFGLGFTLDCDNPKDLQITFYRQSTSGKKKNILEDTFQDFENTFRGRFESLSEAHEDELLPEDSQEVGKGIQSFLFDITGNRTNPDDSDIEEFFLFFSGVFTVGDHFNFHKGGPWE